MKRRNELCLARMEYAWFALPLVTVAIALAPLALPGLWFGHDLLFEVVRGTQYARALEEQGFPPRWAPDLARGYGYPIFLFFPHTFLLLTTVLSYLLGWVAAVKLVLFSVVLSGCLGTFRLARLFVDRPTAALLSSLWACTPYLGYNLWARSAFAETTALAILPWVLWSVVTVLGPIGSSPRRRLAAAAIGAIFAVSHNLTVVLAAPLLMGTAYAAVTMPGRPRTERFFDGLKAVVFACALSAFYTLPVALEVSSVRLNWPMDGRFGVLTNLLGIAGTPAEYAGWVVAATTGLAGVALYKRSGGGRPTTGVMVMAALFVGYLFLVVAPSAPIWRALPALSIVGFPSRLLGPVWLLALGCFGFGLSVYHVRLTSRSRLLIVGVALLIQFGSFDWSGARRVDVTLLDTSPAFLRRAHVTTTVLDEFVPASVQRLPELVADPIFGCTDERSQITLTLDEPFRSEASVVTPSAAILLVRRFAFAGWVLEVDGVVVVPALTKYGTMKVHLAAGTHKVALRWKEPMGRKAATLLSIGALAVWWLLWIRGFQRAPSAEPTESTQDRGEAEDLFPNV
jgi:hypothetical protein